MSEVRSQIFPQIETRYLFLLHNAPYTPSTTLKDTSSAEVVLCATKIHRKSPQKPKGAPRAGGAENANDGKAPARHRDGADQHPRCAPRPKPSRYRTGRTRDVEFIEGTDKCRGGDPDGLFASSLATSTTARARPPAAAAPAFAPAAAAPAAQTSSGIADPAAEASAACPTQASNLPDVQDDAAQWLDGLKQGTRRDHCIVRAMIATRVPKAPHHDFAVALLCCFHLALAFYGSSRLRQMLRTGIGAHRHHCHGRPP